jgi:hypothetical protein
LKKIFFLVSLVGCLLAGAFVAMAAKDHYISNYEVIDLDFLRTHYTEIENGRVIQFDAYFSSYKWLQPYELKQRLSLVGLNIKQYNAIQMSLKQKDDLHYSFPILLFQADAGELKELEQLTKGVRVKIFGKFFKLKDSEYAIETDLIETIKKGGHEQSLLIDARMTPTFTPTFTFTSTPGLSLFQKINNMVNPKETITPTSTATPEPSKKKP